MNNKLHTAEVDHLFDAILSLETRDECYKLFEDMCTINEIHSMAQRLEVAMFLNEGKTFQEIVDKIGASTATIARVNKCLQYGEDGYRTVIERIK